MRPIAATRERTGGGTRDAENERSTGSSGSIRFRVIEQAGIEHSSPRACGRGIVRTQTRTGEPSEPTRAHDPPGSRRFRRSSSAVQSRGWDERAALPVDPRASVSLEPPASVPAAGPGRRRRRSVRVSESKGPYVATDYRGDGLGRAVRPCSKPTLRSSVGTEHRARPVRPARAPGASVESPSRGDDGPRYPSAGTVTRASSAASGQARKRAAHRRTSVAREVAGWSEQPGFPVFGTPGNPGRPHSYSVRHRRRAARPPVD